ncbi:cytochrome P450 [Mycolicibacterium sp. 120270]|uniref:cytochrome P450 n=1 Tax=Mycolicibacterium sp. 120270 TaxID=3090600 RepID=UPI00299F0F10|nr:cytochrome P450 [Mycolicibacterium sp. 120270]MDX1885807.1 cytochrome P450 [Mycolicibacterium sp. 120270]
MSIPSVFEADLPTLEYEEATTPDEAHRNLRKALEQGPIGMGAHGPEILSYELVRETLRDTRFQVPRGLGLETQGITSGPLWQRASTTLLAINGDDHTRLRRLVSKAFTPRSVNRLDGIIVDVITELVDGLSDGRCEVVADIARPYPVPIISALLGAPREDWRLFSDWADDFFKLFSWNVVEHENAILDAWQALDDYIDDMVAARRETLTEDLISEMIRAEDDGDRLSTSELRMLAAGILMAGTDTTRNQLAAAIDVFCDYPDQWALLAERPELAMKAVEEVMRYCPVVFGAMRMTNEDVEIAGVMIPAGTFVMCNTAAANHDTNVYIEPERFDILREDAPPMETFGAGAHYCLGANLARRELASALSVMANRMPDLRHDGVGQWKPMVGITGPATLPVAF